MGAKSIVADAAVSTLLLFLGERHSTALKCWIDPNSLFNPYPILPSPYGGNSLDATATTAAGGGGGGGGGGERREGGGYALHVGYECARAVIELLQLPLNSIVGAEGAVESLAAPIGEMIGMTLPSLLSLSNLFFLFSFSFFLS